MVFAVIFDMESVLAPLAHKTRKNRTAQKESPEDTLLTTPLKKHIHSWNDYFSSALDSSVQSSAPHTLIPDPDLLSLLRDLQANNIRLAVVTSSSRQRADNILTVMGIRRFFPVLLTKDTFPHTELFLAAANQLGVPPEHCIVIDSSDSIQAAQAAHMKTISFSPSKVKGHSTTATSCKDLSYLSLKNLAGSYEPPSS